MDRLECAASGVCRQYCEALRTLGVGVEVGDVSCNVPGMFALDNEGVTFTPAGLDIEGGDARAGQLVNELGGALCGVMMERQQGGAEQLAVDNLSQAYQTAFLAKVELWQAMMGAARDDRQFTDVELNFYQQRAEQAERSAYQLATGSAQELAIRARAAADRVTLRTYNLLFDDQTIMAVDTLVGNLIDGKPAMLTGDKGIAKSQLAKFVAGLWEGDTNREPTIISGHGDMMSSELIGQVEQDKGTGLFAFKEGKLLDAMREGRPVIIDEVNVGDQAVAMRLQDILVRRPGHEVVIQENGDDPIKIRPGFVVFATANEASARYRHRNVLDPAFRDRYDIINLHYPDHSSRSPLQNVPSSLMRLALANAVDERGVLSRHIDMDVLERLVRLSHVTQHLYSVPARDAQVRANPRNSDQIVSATSSLIDDEPLMTDCITPRAMAEAVMRCAAGNKPGLTLASQMEQMIAALDQDGGTHNQAQARNALALL